MSLTQTAAVTVAQALEAAARRLADAGSGTARLDARLLLSHVTGQPPLRFVTAPDEVLSADETARFDALIDRRLRHEPVSHLTGTQEFWSLPFVVDANVLDPRPDSETLVETALALFPDPEATMSVLDLGTGSGCLLLSLLHERRRAHGIGVDLSRKALDIAAGNARCLGLSGRAAFLHADWGDGLETTFDLVLCNPPYIARGNIDSLAPEVALFDPRAALDGGADGLDAYRAILDRLPALLAPDGYAVLEIGRGQAPALRALSQTKGLDVAGIRDDLSGTARCMVLRRAAIFTDT